MVGFERVQRAGRPILGRDLQILSNKLKDDALKYSKVGEHKDVDFDRGQLSHFTTQPD